MVEPVETAPDFYLSSSEYETWREVRKCFVLGKLRGPRPRGCWWIRVEPSVPGSIAGWGPDVSELVLAERYEEEDIARMTDAPVLVYVCRITNPEAIRRGIVEEDDVKLVTWAEVAKRPEFLPTESRRRS